MRGAAAFIAASACAHAATAYTCGHLNDDERALQLARFRDEVLNKTLNPHHGVLDGSSWPPGAQALSMAGQYRLDSFSALVATAVEDGVVGDVIETGVWRGGASFVVARTLELMGDLAAGRRVFLCDSFAGIPKQAVHKDANGAPRLTRQDASAHGLSILNHNSPDRVRSDAVAIGLNVSRLEFVVGFFKDSLPPLLSAEPRLRFAVVRLDGDTYWSTMEAITQLYPRLSPGGFLIVDDYMDWQSCRTAIDQYRKENNITEPIIAVPHRSGNVRGVYWRKLPTAAQALCAGCPKGTLRPAGAHLPHSASQLQPPHRLCQPIGPCTQPYTNVHVCH